MQFQKPIFIFTFLIILSLLHLYCGNSSNEQGQGNGFGTDSTVTDSNAVANADSGTNADGDKNNKKGPEIDAIPVEVTTISRGTIADYILLSTNLETEKMADIYSRVQGVIEKIYVQEGEKVKKNQVLMELEAAEYQLAEERAHLNYLKQEADFNRMKAMFEKDLLSKEEFEQARFTTEGLKVDWEQAKLNYQLTQR